MLKKMFCPSPPVRALLALGLGAAIATAGCNSSSANTTTCAPPPGVQTVLVYPAPGSTGIPDNFGQVVFGSSAALPPTYNAFVFDSTAGGQFGLFADVQPAASPLPSPASAPGFSNPVYQSSANNIGIALQGHTLGVYLNDSGNANCVPTNLLGSFTVQ